MLKIIELLKDMENYFKDVGYPAYAERISKASKAIAEEVEREYIALPKDANGEPINLGDEMISDSSHHPDVPYAFSVRRIGFDDDGETFICCNGASYRPSRCHHHKPTVEDVIEKALNEAAMLDRKDGYWPSAADITNIVNAVAPKLQLKDES